MATFLELVNKVRREVDASGAALAAVTATNAENSRIIGWVQDAWREIQLLHTDWDFMRLDFTANLVNNQGDYTAAAAPFSLASFRNWKKDSFRIHTTGNRDDEAILYFSEYDWFRNTYRFAGMATQQGRPDRFTVAPNRSLQFGLIPTAGWTVRGEYFRNVQELTAAGDIPIMPVEYHDLIFFRAMMIDGEWEWSPEQQQRALRGIRRLTSELEGDQLPKIYAGVTTG